MGNCMETYIASEEQEGKPGGFDTESGFEQRSKVRIKVVLTKEELEWFVFQMENIGGKSLEDMLGEIESNRGKVVSRWKPSLESIMESPQVLDMDRSMDR